MKIGDVISDINLSGDYIFNEFCQRLKEHIIINLYSNLVKALCLMIEKGHNIDKINFVFKNTNHIQKLGFEEKIATYQAFCILEMIDNYSDILDSVEYIKDSKKKKAIKAPEFDDQLIIAKYYQKNQDHNLLIYDKTAEFIIRNRILESFLRFVNNEVDSKPIFKTFNDIYESVLNDFGEFNSTKNFRFIQSEFSNH